MGDLSSQATVSAVAGIAGLVADRYEIRGVLGEGGMGTVYLALDRELDEEVALKMLRPELASTPDALVRFRREVKLARRVTHPNVARTFDLGEHAGVRFLTMERIAGRSLRDAKDLSLPEILRVAWEITQGLAAAHAAGVVHRDLKPDNVLLTNDRVVITDFGIARAEDADGALRTSGSVVGTPAYIAPEQLEGSPVDGRTDVYALGVVLYELVAGVLPFTGETAAAVAIARLTRAPAPIRSVKSGVPDGVADLVMAAPAARKIAPTRTRSPPGSRACAASRTTRRARSGPTRRARSRPSSSCRPPTARSASTRSTPTRRRAPSRPTSPARSVTRSSVSRPCASSQMGPRIKSSTGRRARPVTACASASACSTRAASRSPWSAWRGRSAIRSRSRTPCRSGRSRSSARARGACSAPAEPCRSASRRREPSPLAGRRACAPRSRSSRRRQLSVSLTTLAAQTGAVDEALFARAEEIALRAIDRDPTNGLAFYAAAFLRTMRGDQAGSLAAAREAPRRVPRLADAHHLVGRVLTAAGHVAEGMQRLELAIRLDPRLIDPIDEKIRVLALLGEKDAARRELERVEGVTPLGGVLPRLRLYAWWEDRALARDTHDLLARMKSGGAWEAAMPALDAYANGDLETMLLRVRTMIPHLTSERILPRHRAFMHEIAAEYMLLCGDADGALEKVTAVAAMRNFINLLWLDRCPNLAPLRDRRAFADARARVAERVSQLLG